MKEFRFYTPETPEDFRFIEEDGKSYITGYASRYNQKSKLLTEKGKSFFEIIQRGAFREVLQKNFDVIANLNHDRTKLLSRIKSGTLTLSEDENGLLYRFEVPNVSYALDALALIKRGDIFESSFAFSVNENDQIFTKDESGLPLRTITNISRLYDVAIVIDGAYANTSITARGLEEFEESELRHQEEEKQKNENDIYRKNLEKAILEDRATRLYLKYKY